MRKPLTLVTALMLVSANTRADCFDDAANYHQVNSWVLRAIAFQESEFEPTTVHRNSNNSVDIGLMGTNSVHKDELAKYGIATSDLLQACKSIYVGAWRLKKMASKYGNTCKAIGAYHSETAYYRDIYIADIRKVLAKWGVPLNC